MNVACSGVVAEARRGPHAKDNLAYQGAIKSGLRIIGGRSSHDVLRRVLAERPPVKILDVPSGTGVLSNFLREHGYDVYCADIDTGNFAAQRFPFETVDLNRKLPYPDGSFPAAVCANGLHRLWNPGQAIRELHRILEPGGSLFITVNNYASVQKRLRFLFTGSITKTINTGEFSQTISDPEANFRSCLFYPQLANMLEAAGFRIAGTRASSVKNVHRLLVPLAWLIRFGTLFISKRNKRLNRIYETRSAAVCPGGKYLFIEARKSDAALQAVDPGRKFQAHAGSQGL